MDDKRIWIKGVLSMIGAWISNKLGILLTTMGGVIFLIIIDYISGMLAAKEGDLENPNICIYE